MKLSAKKKIKSVITGLTKKEAPKKVGVANPDQFPVVGIGASAGGLEAFSELLAHLPVNTGMSPTRSLTS